MLRFTMFGICIFLLATSSGCIRLNSESRTLSISEIQGCGHRSPYVDQDVNDVQGIVTKKYENGFVIQSVTPDTETCSSEALFVYTRSFSDVVSGDLVSVSGKIVEFTAGTPDEYNLSQTELDETSVNLLSTGNALPEAVLLGANGYQLPTNVVEDDQMRIFDPESDGLDYFESLEWMRVKLPQSVVVGPRNKYDEIVIEADGEGISEKADRSENVLIEAKDNLHPERLIISLPGYWTKKVNVGGVLESGLIGILNYSYGNYKIDPVSEININKFEMESPKKESAQLSELRIATYNINNFSQYSNNNKVKSLASQIANDLYSPDLLILQEVQDDSGATDDGVVSARDNLKLLIKEIKKSGGGEYQAFDYPPENNSSGGVPGGNIRTTFLLRTDSPMKFLDNKQISESFRNNLIPSLNLFEIGKAEPSFSNVRKPVVGLFTYENTSIVVMGLHLISKGLNSPLYGSRQPIEQPELEKRIQEAGYVNGWVRKVLSQNPKTLVIVAGDMNDTYKSDVLKTAEGTLLTDCASSMGEESRFSVIYDGMASLFDHILISGTYLSFSCNVVHLNSLYDTESRVSDHDPVVISIALH